MRQQFRDNVGFNSAIQTGFAHLAHGYRCSQPEWPRSHFHDPYYSQQLQVSISVAEINKGLICIRIFDFFLS